MKEISNMGLTLSIKGDIDRISRDMTALERKVIPEATNRALNRTGKTAGSRVIRKLSQESGAKQMDIRRRFAFLVMSRPSTLSYLIRIRYGAMPLKDFSPKQTKQGVSAKAWGKTKVYKGAFKVDSLGGHVFTRKTDKRLPLKKLVGPMPAKIAGSHQVEGEVMEVIRQRLPVEMRANVKYYLKQYIKRGR